MQFLTVVPEKSTLLGREVEIGIWGKCEVGRDGAREEGREGELQLGCNI